LYILYFHYFFILKAFISFHHSMNRCFSSSARAAECASSDRVATIRARTLYRDTLKFAASGGIFSGSGAIYAGPITVRGTCLGAGLATTAPVPADRNQCAAFFIHSASSYRDLLDITRGIFAGHAAAHPEAIVASSMPPVPANLDSIRNVLQFSNDMSPVRYNHLTLNAPSAESTANLLVISGGGGGGGICSSGGANTNAIYDAAALSARPVDPLSCVQFPPNPNLSIVYGGGGCPV